MDPSEKKRVRAPNFTPAPDEKTLLASLAADFKNILENKKTDTGTNNDKKTAWLRITEKFNSATPSGIHRDPESLQRWYENKKKEIRKIAANAKTEINKTGGGLPPFIAKEPCHEVLLSVINNKTVYGLDNEGLDGDGERPDEITNANEIIFEYEGSKGYVEIEDSDLERGLEVPDPEHSWQNYNSANLRQPITPALKVTHKENSDQKSAENETPQKRRKPLPMSRRRPATVVRALTSSGVAEKYDLLLNKKLEIAGYQREKMEKECAQMEAENKLKRELYELQIRVEKEKLKKLCREEMLL